MYSLINLRRFYLRTIAQNVVKGPPKLDKLECYGIIPSTGDKIVHIINTSETHIHI